MTLAPPFPQKVWCLGTSTPRAITDAATARSDSWKIADAGAGTRRAFWPVLPGCRDVGKSKMSGGEPFVHPTIHEITAGLQRSDTGFRCHQLFGECCQAAEFVDAARGRVGVFSCSLHREYVTDVAAFIQKARWMRDTLAARDESLPPPSLNVTTVATRQAIPDLIPLGQPVCASRSRSRSSPRRSTVGSSNTASRNASSWFRSAGTIAPGQLAHVYTGEPCWSGARYFIRSTTAVWPIAVIRPVGIKWNGWGFSVGLFRTVSGAAALSVSAVLLHGAHRARPDAKAIPCWESRNRADMNLQPFAT